MRGGGEIGQRHAVARQPAAMVQQPFHVAQVVLDRRRAGLDRLAVGVARAHDLLVHALIDQVLRHLVVELVVEPCHEPPHLGPGAGIGGHQRGSGWVSSIYSQIAPLSVRVKPSILRIGTLPAGLRCRNSLDGSQYFLIHQLDVDLLFRQDKADLAAEGGQREVVEAGHEVRLLEMGCST
jgi:hypothetical protein